MFGLQKIVAKGQGKVLNCGGHKEMRDTLLTTKTASCLPLFRSEDVDSDRFELLDGDPRY